MSEEERKGKQMRQNFEASLPDRVRRASTVKLQPVIPHHWFAAAASECAGMYIAGFFYSAISMTQAYVDALSRYLAQHHRTRIGKEVGRRCEELHRKGIISAAALHAASDIFENRNDFHHLNANIEQDLSKLEARAEKCISLIHVLESEVFAYSFSEAAPGTILLGNPDYWPSAGPGFAQFYLRRQW